MKAVEQEPILKEEKNCWRILNAGRVAFLVDGASYFKAFASAIDQAEKSIYICGWDIDSRIALLREGGDRNRSPSLEGYINRKVSATPCLHAYILYWVFAMIYALELEWLPSFKLGWKTNRCLRFVMDDEHPIGASQHQKIVVIDDTVAFSGGIDLTEKRWDTPEHGLEDPRCRDPGGRPYKPFHDVQMLMDGEAVSTLGDLFRNRWQWATGKTLAAGTGRGRSL